MCTLSFIPTQDGYLVAMNRDELLLRGSAAGPELTTYGDVKVLHPTDIAGGTWIAANEFGATWALLNWNLGRKSNKERSRGEVVIRVAALGEVDRTKEIFTTDLLRGVDPFRLIGISGSEKRIREYRWDGLELVSIPHAWQRNHWFSSGRSDALATENRSKSFAYTASTSKVGTLGWLRETHASHLPDRGAFSVCVHRDDAATVSYTELNVTDSMIRMIYRPGSPCEQGASIEKSLDRLTPPKAIRTV